MSDTRWEFTGRMDGVAPVLNRSVRRERVTAEPPEGLTSGAQVRNWLLKVAAAVERDDLTGSERIRVHQWGRRIIEATDDQVWAEHRAVRGTG